MPAPCAPLHGTRPPRLRARGLAALVLCAACSRADAPRPAAAPARAAGPPPPERVVLVTLDTVRADHLSCYGYPIVTTPFLDRLAAEGALFEHAFSSSSQTGPSHASLMTSLHPGQHGVEANSMLPAPGVPTLAELMHGAGFSTAAFVSVRFLDLLRAGFDTFEYRRVKDRIYCPAPQTVDAALEWVGARAPGERWFLWLHLFDVHEWRLPEEGPEALQAIEGQIADWPAHARRLEERQGLRPAAFRDDDAFHHGLVEYDARIRACDAQLERLYAAVRASGDERRTLWIVTADHGEGLGAHDYLFHGEHVYDEQIHVPLIVHWPGGVPAGRRVEPLVRLIDVVPTLDEILGLTAPGTARFEGLSLLATLREGLPPRADSAFAQRGEDATKRMRGWEPGPIYCLRTAEAKYIHHEHGADELYDVAADPLELRNLARDPAWTAAREELERGATGVFRRSQRGTAPLRRTDEDTERELKALGYTD
jgi:choline-sulfatase